MERHMFGDENNGFTSLRIFFILKIIFAPGSLLIYAGEVMKGVILENFTLTRGFSAYVSVYSRRRPFRRGFITTDRNWRYMNVIKFIN